MLVNNAGITRDGLLVRMSDEHWQAVLDTNLTGAFHTIRRATPGMMKARYGRIVNVSSVGGQIGQAGQANYAAAKAGLLGLTRSVARELARRNITCNVVAPGPIVTAMTDDLPADWRTQVEAAVPLGRFGTAEECAAVDRIPVLGRSRLRHRRGRTRRRRPRHGPLTKSANRHSRGGTDGTHRCARHDEGSRCRGAERRPRPGHREARFKEDLDADSLDLVELVMGLEERFDIEVPEDDLEDVTTVGQARRPRARQGRS